MSFLHESLYSPLKVTSTSYHNKNTTEGDLERAFGKVTVAQNLRGMFEMNCLLSSSSISTWGTIKTNTYLYRAIQYLHSIC